MHGVEPSECVGTGWGSAQIASTVYERGYRTRGRNWDRRAGEGESERVFGEGGVGSLTEPLVEICRSGETRTLR